jgi:hypothetical protein
MTNVCNRFLLTVMEKAKLFPKWLIPVQFRAGAPLFKKSKSDAVLIFRQKTSSQTLAVFENN